MRSHSTNFLQAVVLITGIIYLFIGVVFYVSPLSVLSFFAENVSESWLDLVMDNELVAPLYFISRGFSALLVTSGLVMIMPLFDPLKYRGLVYANGLFFTLFASIMFVKNGILISFFNSRPAGPTAGVLAVSEGREGHLIIILLGIIFSVLFILNLTALLITRKQSKEGIE
jgi:hypothetical protein